MNKQLISMYKVYFEYPDGYFKCIGENHYKFYFNKFVSRSPNYNLNYIGVLSNWKTR